MAQFCFCFLEPAEALERKRLSDSLDVVVVVLVRLSVAECTSAGSALALDASRESAGVVKPLLDGEELSGDEGTELDSLREELFVLETTLRMRSLSAIVEVVVVEDDEA